MSEIGLEILAARQIASLRRHGWSALQAVDFVSNSIPPGHLKTECEEALRHLRSGGAIQPVLRHPLATIVARGDGATGESFEFLAEAWEARDAGQRALAAATRLLSLLVAGPLLLGAAMGWLLPEEWIPSDDLPGPTAATLSLFRALRFLGPPLAVVGIWVIRRAVRGLSPGEGDFAAAAELLQLAATSASGNDEQTDSVAARLAPLERQYFDWRRSLAGVQTAARELANELLRSGRRKVEYFSQIAPVVAAVIAAPMVSASVSTLYLPIFEISKAAQ